MPKSRKPTSKPTPTSTEVGSIDVGGNVTNSNIIIGNNNTIQLGRTPLSAERIAELTKEYAGKVASEWETLRVNEAEIPLKDVFVTLQAVASPSPKNLEKRPELTESSERMKHAGIEPKETPPVPVALSQALKEAQHLVLLGEPGSGKSTTLQFIGLCFVHENWAEDRLQLTEQRIPIKLDLRGNADLLAEPGTAMEEALSRAVQEHLRKISNEDAHELIYSWVDQGRLLVLFDGLDEVPDSQREAVRNEIQKFSSWAKDQECRVVLSSRLIGYSAIGGRFKEFTLKPFEYAEEAIPYLQSWLMALSDEDWGLEQVHQETMILYEKMTTQSALRRILDNPLLLRISAQVYAKERQIATSRANLYQRYTEELWSRAVERGVDRSQKDTVWKIIEELAWSLHMNKAPSISTEMEITIREKMGLIVRMEEKPVFSHTTLQEYFVAKRLQRAWKGNQHGAWLFLRPRLHVPTWREPLLLLCGNLDGEKASNLVRLVLRTQSPYKCYRGREKLLAATLVQENNNIQANINQLVVTSIVKTIKEKNYLPVWALVAELRDAAVPYLVPLLKGKYSEVQRDAVIQLGVLKAQAAVPNLIQLLDDTDLMLRPAVVRALGELKVQAVVPDLIRLLEDEDHSTREQAVVALGELKAEVAVPDLIRLLRDENKGVRQDAAKSLGMINAEAAVPDLIRLLEDEDRPTREQVVVALGEIKAEAAIPDLIRLLKSQDSFTQHSVFRALKKINAQAVVPHLVELLKDEWVCEDAAYLLGQIKAEVAVPALISLLRDGDDDVIPAAARALGEIKGGGAVPDLLHLLEEKDGRLRRGAARALGVLNAYEAAPNLIRLLEDENSELRQAAAWALGDIKDQAAVPKLVQLLKDKNTNLRQAAAWALGDIKDQAAVPDLIRLLDDENSELRSTGAFVLGIIEARAATLNLVRLLDDNDQRVRHEATIALGRIKDQGSVPDLIRLLDDKDWTIRAAAATALGKLKAQKAVPDLIRLLHDESDAVSQEAVKALGEIKSQAAVPDLVRLYKQWEKNQYSNMRYSDMGYRVSDALRNTLREMPIPSNTSEKREQIKWLRKVVPSEIFSVHEWRYEEELAKQEVFSSAYQDPFEPVKPSFARKALRLSLFGLATIFVLGLLAVLGILYSASEDIFKNLLGPTLSTWILAHQSTAFLIFISLAVAIGLLTWAAEKLKDAFGGTK